MDDTNESMDTVEQPPASSGRGDFLTKAAIDRRVMLKGAVAAGVFAGTWVAPRIQSLGFLPAAAAGTPCIILSPKSDDKNSHDSSECTVPTPPPSTKGFVHQCCGQSFGSSSSSQVDDFTFKNPVANCSEIVVRLVSLPCGTTNLDPDVGQFGVVISSATGTNCGACTIKEAVIIESSGRTVLDPPINNGPIACDLGFGNGIDASVACNDTRLVSSSRLAVRLACIGGTVGCTPP